MPKTILEKRQSCVWETYLFVTKTFFRLFFSLNLPTEVGGFSTTFQRISLQLLPRFSRFCPFCPRLPVRMNKKDKQNGKMKSCIFHRKFPWGLACVLGSLPVGQRPRGCSENRWQNNDWATIILVLFNARCWSNCRKSWIFFNSLRP